MTSQEWTNVIMKDNHGKIRDDLQKQSETIREAYEKENRQELEQMVTEGGETLAENLLGEYNHFLQEHGQPSLVFKELEMLALAVICTCFLEAVSKLLQLKTENKRERNWVKSEVHSCAANTSQAIHFAFGEIAVPRYIGNGVSRNAVLQVAREFFEEDSNARKLVGVGAKSLVKF
ncbi:hypothetical protein MK805_17340 [Shimazuella sp. AN120528]|uniref:hypothetical protein n=1 Tax=Shimazuella soli TaxID=1892854 RepID=UPI001F0F6A8A|nr:hypothetical protein [Shimazuella soli]MCH5586700.1 hypothetical protein [Shimazuella soli]